MWNYIVIVTKNLKKERVAIRVFPKDTREKPS